MSKKILILNGPNLNLLGMRQPEVYGDTSLAELDEHCRVHGATLGFEVDCRQSNCEGTLIDWLHEMRGTKNGIVLNAGAYSHTSVAIMDAIASVERPLIEVHLSNIHARERFRHHSYISKVATGTICGLGTTGYMLAIDALADILDQEG
ncbi:type II 3-dehydroquinate dehydratase [Polycladidibacter hongkongensis]|uniref:type II 3-dehydroquinate dehydratase n=1 Tax=Polycladidibacter hongkongensis TaxID=1647556 RepID=UPI00082BAACA|nr:type II 3-dehydroquinate dehydratase [Pseudovibrio hongkongensis]